MISVPGRVLRPLRVTREAVRANPDMLYAFGDNMSRKGMGGQAGAMRGEPNAVGVPTKWAPCMRESCFFHNEDLANPEVIGAIDAAFGQLRAALKRGRHIVIPADGLGTGLAALPKHAPAIHAYIEDWIKALTIIAEGNPE
jgi:hypothetical protein